ncbi:MAG: hypothetical protein GX684_03265 [Ruminococcaceae bacterium]|nr:hypothetical protein [Oscillospiraceae bacterium]
MGITPGVVLGGLFIAEGFGATVEGFALSVAFSSFKSGSDLSLSDSLALVLSCFEALYASMLFLISLPGHIKTAKAATTTIAGTIIPK